MCKRSLALLRERSRGQRPARARELDGHVEKGSAGIIDVAPTIAHAMGFARPAAMDGRVLTEAMRVGAEPVEPITLSRSVARGNRFQHLRLSQMGATIYLDAGWVGNESPVSDRGREFVR